MSEICDCCQAGSLRDYEESQSAALFAVCDVLVFRALEQIGKVIVRSARSRFKELGDLPWREAHTLWPPSQYDPMISKNLVKAWDVVPALLKTHGCCGVESEDVTAMLDEYVRDLLVTGQPHRPAELRYRFETRLGVALPILMESHSEASAR